MLCDTIPRGRSWLASQLNSEGEARAAEAHGRPGKAHSDSSTSLEVMRVGDTPTVSGSRPTVPNQCLCGFREGFSRPNAVPGASQAVPNCEHGRDLAFERIELAGPLGRTAAAA